MFLFPLNNSAIKQKDPEHAAFMQNEEQLLARYLDAAGLKTAPLSFDDYLSFVTHTLEKFKSDGAIALKFELAYLRDLDISNPKKEDVERIYTIYAQPAQPSPEESKALEDYMFRYIAAEAGRLGLSIHIHTSIGVGSYFRAANANPLALEPIFNDPSLRKTKFVMLHGSWPFTREAGTLILKPNVFIDFSAYYYLTYPAQAAKDLRFLLEMAPEKVLYGSDASPFSDNIGWEETALIASKLHRQELGMAITAMIDDGEITTDRGKKLVHMVLRDNARQLYGL
jgi:predicted TIM-barrel fold metal-dependent hydrolase